MTAISKGNGDVIAKLTPGGDLGLAHLSDDELLANTRRLVGKTNQLLAALLAHLAEVEARGVHRTRRCASLYTYCIYELRFSEDAAARRSTAARLVKQFPPLFDAIADGELHLTGLLMIGPHLTPENHVEVLGRAKFRTKKELSKLLRDLNPLPDVPDRIEPAGPALMRALRNPTWEEYVTALAPRVRELPAGERPRDWVDEVAAESGGIENGGIENGGVENEGVENGAVAAGVEESFVENDPLPVGPAPCDLPPVTGPQHYQVQFTVVEEHARLVERAKALLARTRPGMTLGELHLEAMKLLVASLEKRRFAVTDRPRARAQSSRPKAEARPAESETDATRQRGEAEARQHEGVTPPRQRGEAEARLHEGVTPPRQRHEPEARQHEVVRSPRQRRESETSQHEVVRPPRQRGETAAPPRKRSRYIPAAERREVFQRDAGRCTYVDARGERCCETRYLELHHLQPFAKNGASGAANLTLRCAAHNALAAEEDFGTWGIAERRDSTRHEALSRQPLWSDDQ